MESPGKDPTNDRGETPRTTLAAVWRRASPLTRVLLVAWGLVPIGAAVVVLALPSDDRVVVRGPADSKWIIAERRSAFDGSATGAARATVAQVEACFADTEDFTLCDTATEIAQSGELDLPWGNAAGEVSVEASTVDTYRIAAISRTAAVFFISRDGSGSLSRTCVPSGAAGCRADGTW